MIQMLLFILFMQICVNFTAGALTGGQPDVTASLSAGITAGDDVIPVNTVDGLPGAGIVYVGNEALTYTAKTSSCPSPFGAEPACLTGAIRGAQQSEAVSHSEGARVYGELSGSVNQLASGMEITTSIDDQGSTSATWGFVPTMIGILVDGAKTQVSALTGSYQLFGLILGMFNFACLLGVGYLMWSMIRGR